jgi:hypothetical protein
MKTKSKSLIRKARFVLAFSLWPLAFSPTAPAAVTIIGVQYRPDQLFPEFNCFWNASTYPTSCAAYVPGATVHVFLKNTGVAAVTMDDATLAGSSLKTIIKKSVAGSINPDMQNSIYFYWDDPPTEAPAIMAAGEPVWFRFDPPTIPPGGVAQAAVRLRSIPTTQSVSLAVVTDAGTVTTNIAVDANAPQVANIGYSEDLTKIYINWRRTPSGGGSAAPTSVWLDGTNVTAFTTTVGDTNMNFGASVISLPNAMPFFSYHVYQGVYADGKTATASQRAWTNKFIYATYSTFAAGGGYDAADWLDEAADHGFNNVQFNLGEMGSYMGTVGGRAHMQARGYGYTILDKTKLNPLDPDMWFLNDEPDTEEQNQSRTHCGTGLRIPCDSSKYAGTLVIKEAVGFAAELRDLRPNVPTVVNLDGGLQPQSWFTWGPALDILQSNNYYDVRLRDSYWFLPQRIPLYKQAKLSYAVARTGTAGASPNPFNHLLYSVKWKCTNPDNCGTHLDETWPFPTPESKRFEIYYSLAGGSKGMGYWWFTGGSPSFGLKRDAECAPLWKEMGLCGNEIKTARNIIVTSTPVDLPLAPSTNVWVRAAASGTDTLILYVVNDNYYSDQAGCHYTLVNNATVTASLPSWMQASPTAFEVTPGGLRDVNTQLNGNQLQVNLGTLRLTRMIILTTNPQLRTTVQQRYDVAVRPGVCNFAPEFCTNSPPSITQQPVNRSVAPGGTTNFTLVASGSGTLGYQWQKNSANLGNGGHYSGATTGTLTISAADNDDLASYRCVVTNAYGGITSTVVTLTITNPPATPTANAGTSVMDTSFTANWTSASGATGYRLDVSTDMAFGSFVSGYNNLDVGNELSRGVSGLIGGTPYYYRVRAYNEAGASGNSGIISVTTTTAMSPPHAPVASAATGVVSNGFTANWNSAIGATGYRLDVSTTDTFSGFVGGYNNLEVGNVLSQDATGLTTGETYFYRVRGYNGAGTSGNSGAIAVTLLPANPCVTLANANFEGGFGLAGGGYIANNWTEWETYPGVTIGYDETAIVHGGGHSQRIRVGGTNATSGGVYQRLPAVAGQPYSVSVWMYAGDALTTCYLGVNPAGGTNAASGVAWSSGTANAAWVPETWTGIATANYITVFLKVAAPDIVKRNGYFDDATPAAPTAPLELHAEGSGDALTLTWPECPAARLEWAESLSVPVNWTTVTNEVNVDGGQKSLNWSQTDNAGFFRLVVE